MHDSLRPFLIRVPEPRLPQPDARPWASARSSPLAMDDDAGYGRSTQAVEGVVEPRGRRVATSDSRRRARSSVEAPLVLYGLVRATQPYPEDGSVPSRKTQRAG